MPKFVRAGGSKKSYKRGSVGSHSNLVRPRSECSTRTAAFDLVYVLQHFFLRVFKTEQRIFSDTDQGVGGIDQG